MWRKVTIPEGTVGLVFRKKNLYRPLPAGSHWIPIKDMVMNYDQSSQFFPPKNLNLMLRNAALAEMLEVVTVKDGELVLRFEDGQLRQVLNVGRYAFWKGVVDHRFLTVTLNDDLIGVELAKPIMEHGLVRPYLRKWIVTPGQHAALFINGRFVRLVDEGVHRAWVTETPIEIRTAEKRSKPLEIPGQEMLTKDKAALRINFTAMYQVTDPVKALVEAEDYLKQLYLLLQLALREVVSTLTLDELLDQKLAVAEYVLETVRPAAKQLGVEISQAGVKDIILPGDVKEIMNRVLVAQKQAEAQVITRREETASTRSLLNTAKLMEENPLLLRLKELEYVEKITEKVDTINLNGSQPVLDQLRTMFTTGK